MFSFVFSCVHCSLFFIWFLLLPVVFIFLRESFAVLEQCYSTAFFLKVTDFFILILLLFVNVHYLEDCTLRVCVAIGPAEFGVCYRVYSGTFQGFAVRFTTFKSGSSCEGGRFFFFSLVSK